MNYTPCTPFPYLPEQLAALAELALDLRWSWSHATDILWQRIDSELWALTRNPWLVLQNASGDSLQALAADRDFVASMLVWTVTIASLLFLALLGGVGEHAPQIRQRICEPLGFLGLALDAAANQANGTRVSAVGSKSVLRITANEEEVIRDLVEASLGSPSFSFKDDVPNALPDGLRRTGAEINPGKEWP